MPLLETLIAGIGAAVAKGVLKIWMKEEPIVQSASTSMVDILNKKLGNILERRAAERELAKITERSAASFQRMLEKDGPDLPETDIEFIANAASAVIQNTPLTAELLATNDLDPQQLSEFFIARPGAEGGNPGLAFDADPAKQALFRRLIFTASQQIIDSSSRLPTFSERAFREILQRENRIYNVVANVLDGMDLLVAAQQGLDPEAERFETNFRLACIRKFDHLQLFGVDLDESNQRYKLNVAYVTLEVEKTSIDESEGETTPAPNEDGDDFREALPVDQALAKAQRLLVRGLAGAGKTTLVQWIAVFCAAKEHTGELESLNELVPFVVTLRDVENGELPNPNAFASLVAPHTGGEPDRWSHRMLERGKAIVLIDGLDEADEELRTQVREWLKGLLEQYPNARFVVTTRPHAVNEGWLDADGFVDATLQEMGFQDVTRFVDHWHKAVASGLDADEDKQRLPVLAEALKKVLRKNSDLARLATSPLLCAMICALHRDRNQVLPNDRIGLYRACIDMFFRRDNERKVRMGDYVELTDNQKLLLLRSLAWWLIRNGKSSATPHETAERLEHALSELNPPPVNANGEKVLRLFIHRVAMLQQFATAKVNFPHRTFQEYLAAQEALAEGDSQLIVAHAEKDQWREVAILAAGLIENKEDAENFVMSLLIRGDHEKKHQHSLYLIGAAARQNVTRLPDGSRLEDETLSRLTKIIPPKSMKSATELSKAGNLVVPLLPYRKRSSANEVAASTRTLALIGSPEAVSTLFDYIGDDRVTVRRQLNASSQYLPDEFRSEFVHRFVTSELERAGLTEQTASKVTVLYLANIFGLETCSRFSNCISLQELLLRHCSSLSDVSALRNCHSLQTLDLWGSPSLSNVSALGNCQSLQSLCLGRCTSLSDVSGLGNCQSLRTLDLSNCSSLSDVSGLGNCQSLRTLDLGNCSSLLDVSDLGNCHSLQTLDLYGCSSLSDVSALGNCQSLQSLNFWGCLSLSDVKALGNCQSLQTLSLIECSSLSDVSALGNLQALRTLYLSSCSLLRDVSALANCESLQTLHLSGCSSLSKSNVDELRKRLPELEIEQ